MNDDELEQVVRSGLRAAADRPVPETLVARAEDIPRSTPRAARRSWRLQIAGGVATAAAAVVLAVLAVSVLPPGHGPIASGTAVTGSASPTSSAGVSAAPSAGSTVGASSPAPTPLPAGPDVPLAGLSDATHGWVVTGNRLLVTADGGSTWRDATPPGGFATGLLGVAFADAMHGWVAVNGVFTTPSDPGYGRVDVWRTADAGHSWSRSRLPPARFHPFGEIMAQVQFDFLDASHGFAFLSGNEAKGRNDSDLFWTADGGATWSADRPTGTGSVGNEGSVAFATATDGVIVNALHGTGIVVTRDGGGTWTDATLAVPSGVTGAQAFMGQPVFTGERSGLLAVNFQTDAANAVWVYDTSDAGASWTALSRVPPGFTEVAFLDQQDWLSADGPELAQTTDGGRTWTRIPATGLPGPASLSMADAQHGWALVYIGVCLTFKSDCESRAGLYSTADGGRSWAQLEPH
jgi:photosystem II stability/assembly factor-like uncharacterized protein